MCNNPKQDNFKVDVQTKGQILSIHSQDIEQKQNVHRTMEIWKGRVNRV